MLFSFFRSKFHLVLLAFALVFASSTSAFAAPEEGGASTSVGDGHSADAVASAAGGHDGDHAAGSEAGHSGETEAHPVFEAEHGTWFNILARNLFATPEEKQHMKHVEEVVPQAISMANAGQTPTSAQLHDNDFKKAYEAAKAEKAGEPLTDDQKSAMKVHYVAKYDWLLYTPLLWGLLALTLVGAARKSRVRPEGKPASRTNLVEAAVEAFQNYLIGVMGEPLARKYLPLVASFFFTILVSNWLGLIPGMLAATVQPGIPIALAIVAFVAVHIIAIRETSVKSWFMHFVGEPLWLAPINFPLHLIGELIKPLSLSLRLLCNLFGEEMVVVTLIGLSIAFLPQWLPIPFQLPMLFLGTFFGFLQALVFSTLLGIYISIFATHHDDHGGHESVEHATDSHGNKQIVAHPSAATVGS